MRIRATASASARSNAIGVVELDCTPHGLLLGFLGVGAFSEGYAPGALTSGVQITVPWHAVRQARAEGDQLYLDLDWPGLPHDKLTLTRFSLGTSAHPLELRRQRLILHVSSVGAAAIASLVAAAVVPHLSARATATLTLSVGAAAALLVLAVAFLVDQRLLGSPLQEASLRAAFVGELERYVPNLVRTPIAPAAPAPPRRLPNLAGFLPRTTTAIAITLAAGILAAVGTTRQLLRPPERAPVAQAQLQASVTDGSVVGADAAPGPSDAAAAPPELEREPTGEAQAPSNTSSRAEGLTVVQRCACDRASSPLWQEPIPTLGLIVIGSSQTVRRDRTRTQLELAVVNNGNRPLEEITVHVTFFEGNGKQRREAATRPLYFEGPLGPGRAIKWSTEARGTHWEIDPPFFGELDPSGSNAAPSAEFRELLTANHRPVRLHAARMLAFLGDASAAQATLQLKEALRSAEAPYLRRLLAALADVRVCDLRVHGDGAQRRVEACVYNATDEDRAQIGLQLVALDRQLTPDRPVDAPPTLLGDRKWPLPEALGAHSGVLVQTTLDLAAMGAEAAVAFEAHADRLDLLE